MPVIIKRYQNRKLYNTESKRYITLEGIEELIKSEQEVKVIDNHTGQDITAVTLSQIIFEFEKNRSGFLPFSLLLSLVQSGGNRLDDIRQSIFNSLNLYHHYDVEIERRVNLLMEQGELTQEAGTLLLGKLLAISHQLHDSRGELEGRIVRYLLDRQFPSENTLQELIQRVEVISQRVDEIRLNNRKVD